MMAETLRGIRAAAAPGDLHTPALKPPPRLPYQPSMTSRYIKPELRPGTLDDLRTWAGKDGAAAVAEAKARAVSVWQMSNELVTEGAVVCLLLCQAEARLETGLPSHDGAPWSSPLATLNPADQHEVRQVARLVYAEWERQGCPGLLRAIHATQQYVHLARLNLAEATASQGDPDGGADR